MSWRTWQSAALLAGTVAMAGCGSAQHSGRSSTDTGASRVSQSSSSTGTTTRPSTTVATSTGGSSSDGSRAARRAAEAPDTNVRLPATFTIGAGDALDPPVIGAPKDTDVALTVVSGDGRAHAFALLISPEYRTTVRPSRSAHVLLKGIPDGTYAVEIDHVRRGSLIIGAAPGP